jgi:hypothetical protein
MSNEVYVRGVRLNVKVRRPWVVGALSAVTFGIYFLFWYYKVNREMRDFGASLGDGELATSRPVRSILAVTFGGLIVIPEIVSYVRTVRRMQAVERIATGNNRTGWPLIAGLVGSTILGLAAYVHGVGPVLALVALAALAMSAGDLQARLNQAWKLSGTLTGEPADSAQPVVA